jgi:hypothetical protein
VRFDDEEHVLSRVIMLETKKNNVLHKLLESFTRACQERDSEHSTMKQIFYQIYAINAHLRD